MFIATIRNNISQPLDLIFYRRSGLIDNAGAIKNDVKGEVLRLDHIELEV